MKTKATNATNATPGHLAPLDSLKTNDPKTVAILEKVITLKTGKKIELFDYQKYGARWLAGKRFALLADRQRLGKSCQAIRAAELIGAQRILVICRAVAVDQWVSEFEKWWPDSPRSLEQLTVVSYEKAVRKVEYLSSKPWDIMIVDESHYLKSHAAKRTISILGVSGLVHKALRTWLLTGTPSPNHAGELWTTMFTFGATKLKYNSFIAKYCTSFYSGFGVQISGTTKDPEMLTQLKESLAGIMLRRTEEDVAIELPKVFHTEEAVSPGHVELSDIFPDELKALTLPELTARLESELGLVKVLTGQALSTTGLLESLKAHANSVSTLRRYTAMQKVQPLAGIITEELENRAYNKVVIFCVHRQAAMALARELEAFSPVLILGGVSNRAELISKFQDLNSKVKVLIGNIDAAGTSITLTSAHHIYFLEEDWVPGNNDQAKMRCGGIDQKMPIFVKTVVLKNSIDEKVSRILRRKSEELQNLYQKHLP